MDFLQSRFEIQTINIYLFQKQNIKEVMHRTVLSIIFCLALVKLSLSDPTRFQRNGKSMLYQYFHRPGQNLYVRGYENEPEFEGQQQNGRTNAEGEVCITGC